MDIETKIKKLIEENETEIEALIEALILSVDSDNDKNLKSDIIIMREQTAKLGEILG